MRRSPVVLLVPVLVLVTMAGQLSASAAGPDPDAAPVGARDGKAQVWAAVPKAPDVAPAAAPQAVCSGGMAAGFPCRNVDFMSQLPLASMGGGSGSAGWGWTDPSNGREYAIVGRTNGTAFVDVTNATAPVYLGNLPSATGTSSWRELAVHNNTAYIVSDNNGAHGMQVFDLLRLRSVTNPPVTFTADARNTSFGRGHTIHINSQTGIIYVNGSDTCSGGPRMFNTTNRLSPTFLGCLSGDGYTHDSQGVIYAGPDNNFKGREILVASNEDTVTVWDVTTKTSPVMLSRKTYTGRGYTHQGRFTEDHHYFLLDDELDESNFGGNTRTYVWDMSNLSNPLMIGVYTGTTAAIDHNQFVKGNFSYQATYRAGLRILDLTNIANPSTMTEAGFFDVDPASNAASFAGTWHNYPYYPSGNVALFNIQQGLIIVRPNLGGNPNPPVTVYSDTFEAAGGWVTNPNGTDTATTGQWERGDPEQTTSGVVLQLGTTVSGVNDLVTARLAGASAGANDIDGGTTSIQSPAIALPATGTLTVNFSWYLAHLNNATNADFLRVSVVHSGGTTTLFQQLGAASNRAGSWASASADLSAFAGQSIRILVSAADAATGSLVEAGIDNVTITQQT
ncbi:MAG TPA: choice-of-anchor B family protein [Micromonosporaceae bacterium]|nr:choice-of-anchor B family protein [Micromonosporaceae bacterium]